MPSITYKPSNKRRKQSSTRIRPTAEQASDRELDQLARLPLQEDRELLAAQGRELLATKAHAWELQVQGTVLQLAVLALRQVGQVPEVEEPGRYLEEDSDMIQYYNAAP